jgi:hypothetical protein
LAQRRLRQRHRAAIDYDAWPLNKSLNEARENGTLSVYWLGLGMVTLTPWTSRSALTRSAAWQHRTVLLA